MRTLTALLLVLSAIFLVQCGGGSSEAPEPSVPLTVAAAANLSGAFEELAKEYKQESGADVTLSFGSTAQLAQQIEHGGPFDLFAAADTEHIDSLVAKNLIVKNSRHVYAQGRLALWVPKDSAVASLQDLTKPDIKFVSIAKPEVAPYGRAAVEALTKAGLWESIEPKVVYAENILMARQLVDSGNANAGLIAFSQADESKGKAIEVDAALFNPIEQALGIVSASKKQSEAKAFSDYVLGPRGQALLARHGYHTGK